MFSKVLRDCILLTLCGIGLVMAWTHRFEIYELAGLDTTQFKSTQNEAATETAMPALSAPLQTTEGATVSIRKSPDGHFWANGQVNRGYVKFLVDTGASAVALTPEDAQKAGIDMRSLKFDSPVMTANGQAMAARVTIKSLAIGSVRVRNVNALVVPEGLSVSLLGMSYLGKLQKVEATPQVMILRL